MTDVELELLRCLARGCRLSIPPSISSSYRAYMTRIAVSGKCEVSRWMVDNLIQRGYLETEPITWDAMNVYEKWRVVLTDASRAALSNPSLDVEQAAIPEHHNAPITDILGRSHVQPYSKWS